MGRVISNIFSALSNIDECTDSPQGSSPKHIGTINGRSRREGATRECDNYQVSHKAQFFYLY